MLVDIASSLTRTANRRAREERLFANRQARIIIADSEDLHHPSKAPNGGVICEKRTLHVVVIPAKAGIYSTRHWKCYDGLDSRSRRNDGVF
jgi:hypothetical protein